MTNAELADEIERKLRNDSSLDPVITLAEATWLEIIAALRQPDPDTLTMQDVEAGNMLVSMQGPPELLSGKPHEQSDNSSGQEKTPENGIDR